MRVAKVSRSVVFLLALAFLFLSFGSTSEALDLITPANGVVTTDSFSLFGWNLYPGSSGDITNGTFDSYRIVISKNADLSSPLVSEDVTNAYYNLNNIANGKWYWKVYVVKGGVVISESFTWELTKVDKPGDFKVQVYVLNGEVKLVLDTPVGSSVNLTVDGPIDPIHYNPSSIQNKELVLDIDEPGKYYVSAVRSYHGFVDTFETEFEIIDTSVSSSGGSSGDSNETKFYEIEFKVTNGTDQIKDVELKFVNLSNHTIVKDIDFNESFMLPEGTYRFNFSKKGFDNDTLKLNMNKNRSVVVSMRPPIVVEPKRPKSIDTESKGLYEALPAWIKYSADWGSLKGDSNPEDDLDEYECTLLFNVLGHDGWEILKGKSGSRFEDKKSGNMFSLRKLDNGKYIGQIKCVLENALNKGKDDYVIYSDNVTFEVRKPFERVDFVSGALVSINSAEKKLNELSDFEKSSLESFGVFSELTKKSGDLEKIQASFDSNLEDVNSNLTTEEYDLIVKTNQGKVKTILDGVLSDVEVLSKHDIIMYLPFEDFDSLLEGYFLENDLLTRDEKTEYKKVLPLIQDEYMLTITVTKIKLYYSANDPIILTLVTKSFDRMSNQENDGYLLFDDLRTIEYIDPLVAEGEKLNFIDGLAKLGNGYFETEEGVSSYSFFIVGDISYDRIKEIGSIIMYDIMDPPALDAITGMGTGSRVMGVVKNTVIPSFIVIALVAVLGAVMIPGSPYQVNFKEKFKKKVDYKSEVVRMLHEAVNIIEATGIENALHLYPKIISYYDALGEEDKAELGSVISILTKELNCYSCEQKIMELKKKVDFQVKLGMPDDAMYTESMKLIAEIKEDLNFVNANKASKIQSELSNVLADFEGVKRG